MRYLFLHQNMPAQFVHLTNALAREAGSQVVFVTQREGVELAGVSTVRYKPHRKVHENTHPYLRRMEEAVLNGQQVARTLMALKRGGFTPDVVVGHPGWGETLFVKDVAPDAPLLSYCEFYFGSDEYDEVTGHVRAPQGDEALMRRMQNAHMLMALEAADLGWSPTEWQKNRHPEPFWPKIEVVFEGVDTETVRPDPNARFALPEGGELTADDEVITFTARGLEPLRGFPKFMRALPEVLAQRPNAQVVIAGNDKSHYGRAPGQDVTWRQLLEKEVQLPPGRVHFTNWVARPNFVRLLQVSSLHVHLSIPFTASWSLFEAMGAGCLVLASDTEPNREVLRPGENGLATTTEDPAELAAEMLAALAHPDREGLRRNARAAIEARYSLALCLPQQLALVRRLTGG